MRHHQVVPWILYALVLGACGKTTDKTELMVTVWTDFSVPEDLDEVRIHVTGEKGGNVDRSFVLTSTGEQGKVPIPVRLGLAPGGAKDASITVSVTGFSKKTEIVWQTATLPFIPDRARELDIYLANACRGFQCLESPGMTCEPTTGRCDRPIAVPETKVKPYTPGQAAIKPEVVPIRPDAAVAEAGGDGPAGETAADVKRGDASLDAGHPDVETDVPTGTGGTGGMEGSTGGGDTGGKGGTGGEASGGVMGTGGLGGLVTTGGSGGMTIITTSSSGAVDAGVDGATDAPASGGAVGDAFGPDASLGGASGGTMTGGGTTASGGSTMAGGASGGSTMAGGASGGDSSSGGAGSGGTVSAAGGTSTGGATGGAAGGGAGGTVGSGGSTSTGTSVVIGATPPMGWNSWNAFGCEANFKEESIRAIADALVSTGMKQAGYEYVNLDECWMDGRDSQTQVIKVNTTRFPSGMAALADYVHGKGLKLGIYSSPNSKTCVGQYGGCTGCVGSLGHESIDAQTYAEWGIDYLKYDKCNGQVSGFATMHDAIRATNRPIFISINPADAGPFCSPASCDLPIPIDLPNVANMWRIEFDIAANWQAIIRLIDANKDEFIGAGPGHWNDPDVLQVGNGLNDTEGRAQFSMWVIMASPLITGNDLRYMSDTTKTILTNQEAIAINQDPLGQQGRVVATPGTNLQVWSKELSGSNARGVALFNRSSASADITVRWSDLGIPAGQASVRDIWAATDVGPASDSYTATNVASHGVVLLKIVSLQ